MAEKESIEWRRFAHDDLEAAAGVSSEISGLARAFAILQPYSVAVRYPFELDLSEGDELRALASAEEIANAIESILDTRRTHSGTSMPST